MDCDGLGRKAVKKFSSPKKAPKRAGETPKRSQMLEHKSRQRYSKSKIIPNGSTGRKRRAHRIILQLEAPVVRSPGTSYQNERNLLASESENPYASSMVRGHYTSGDQDALVESCMSRKSSFQLLEYAQKVYQTNNMRNSALPGVESIAGVRADITTCTTGNLQIEALVKWKGLPFKSASWIPLVQVPHCNALDYYRPMIEKISRFNQQRRRSRGGRGSSQNADGTYNVEDVLGILYDAESKLIFYLIKWTGYALNKSSWEPEQHVTSCPLLIEPLSPTIEYMKETFVKRKREVKKSHSQATRRRQVITSLVRLWLVWQRVNVQWASYLMIFMPCDTVRWNVKCSSGSWLRNASDRYIWE